MILIKEDVIQSKCHEQTIQAPYTKPREDDTLNINSHFLQQHL